MLSVEDRNKITYDLFRRLYAVVGNTSEPLYILKKAKAATSFLEAEGILTFKV
jgi:hypothetical protein